MSPEAWDALNAWSFEPTIWLGTVLLVGAYLLMAGPWRSRFPGSKPVGPLQRIWFLSGSAILLLSLVSPLDEISDHYLFSAHMVQHIFLTLVAPPLLIAGTPGWMLQPLLHIRLVKPLLKFLTMPLIAFTLFNLDFAIWHVPMFYEGALENETLHIAEHLLFIGTAVLNWMPILSPVSELPRLPEPAQILYLFLDAVPSTVLGAIFIFANTVMYPTYAAAPPIFGVGALEDQLYAGLIMAMPGAMIYLIALSMVFFRWLGKEDAAQAQSFLSSHGNEG